MDTTNSYPDIQPAQNVEFTDEEYIKNLRFLESMHNRPYDSIPVISSEGTIANGSRNFIEEYFQNLQYIYGTQIPADYNFFIQDYSGNKTKVPMVRGLDVYKIFNYMHGQTVQMVKSLPKTTVAKAYSSGALSAKKTAMDFAYFQIKHNDILKAIEQESGYGFKAVDRDFKSQDEVDKFFENFDDGMEKAYNHMAKDAFYSNDYLIRMPKGGDYVLVGNRGSMCVEYVNGRPKHRLIPPEQAIIDMSKGLDVHIDDSYGGEAFMMELNDCLAYYKWTPEEEKRIVQMADNSGGVFSSYYATGTSGIPWFSNNSGTKKIKVVKGQWRSLEKDEDGQWKECLREGDLIGNEFLKKQKKSPGQVSRSGDYTKKQIKYLQFTPSLMMGTPVSIVGITKRYQDLKDAFITKVIAMAASAKGKVVIIRTAKLPEGMTTPDFISQLTDAGIIVDQNPNTDEKQDGKKMVESIDLTLDPGIDAILRIAQYFQNEIADFTDTSPIVRGQQDNYQSGQVVNNIQSQSAKGRAFYFEGMKLWIKEIIKYSVNQFKLMAPYDELGRDNLSLIIGDSLATLLDMKTVKEMSFEDFLFDLDTDNFADEKKKADLIGLTIQTAGSPQARKVLKDYVKLNKLDTFTEMDNYLEAEIFKDNSREDQQMQAQQDAAAQNSQVVAESQKAIADTQSMLTKYVADQNNATKAAEAKLKSDTALEIEKMRDEAKSMETQLKLLLEDRALDIEEKRIEKESKESKKKENKE